MVKGAGLAVGQVFQRSTLEGMQQSCVANMLSKVADATIIDTEIILEPRNRVSIAIDVNEGTVSKIKHINVVGNSVFTMRNFEAFELQETGVGFHFSKRRQVQQRKA